MIEEIFKNVLVAPELSVREVMQKLGDTGREIVFVVDAGLGLLGVITNGDVRSFILKNGNLEEKAVEIMTRNPVVVTKDGKEIEKAKKLMKSRRLSCIPIIDLDNRIVSAVWWEDFFEEKLETYENINLPVVIMAGGMGTRLEPFTRVLPKPLIPIGEKTIIEIIMDKYRDFGCNEFHVSINYKANMVKAYFSDSATSYDISYIEEPKFLGTAGSLKLLEEKFKKSFFVNNCDIIVDVDYSKIYDYHKNRNNAITIVCSMKNFRMPYGIIEMDGERNLIDVKEKPEFNFLINAGMYLLEPSVFKYIPADKFFHITDLIKTCKNAGEKIGIFSIQERAWTDIGQVEELFLTLKKFETQKRI